MNVLVVGTAKNGYSSKIFNENFLHCYCYELTENGTLYPIWLFGNLRTLKVPH